MTVRAVADVKFIRKYLFLAAAGLGFFLWGAYDEFVRFPLKLEEAIAYDPDPERSGFKGAMGENLQGAWLASGTAT